MNLLHFTIRKPSEQQVFHGSRARILYELIGWWFRDATDLRFMNYGYAFESDRDVPKIRPEDEAERYCAHLYHAVAAQADLRGRRVLDIGSGRGGGASYVHRYRGPSETVGCDVAEHAIDFCTRLYADIPGLSFRRGNAMDLPFDAAEFDAILNVESSHCYPSRAAFFAEVFRVLKPGGHFLYTDFTPPRTDPAAERLRVGADLAAAGFAEAQLRDITSNILRGLDHDDDRRHREIKARFPFGTRRFAHLWAGTRGSWIYRDFAEGRRAYLMYRASKPDLAGTAHGAGPQSGAAATNSSAEPVRTPA
ncbi:class I SAM-dependent methyltransferase [Defluviimonas sp. SAOS-178_SWC]|uniref:class I SAM-dependent methyltransferase n=1 Tax=Defluviimonas sp. SAOS-178_SWC TaxID=3121287 RepID=UPI00322195A5